MAQYDPATILLHWGVNNFCTWAWTQAFGREHRDIEAAGELLADVEQTLGHRDVAGGRSQYCSVGDGVRRGHAASCSSTSAPDGNGATNDPNGSRATGA